MIMSTKNENKASKVSRFLNRIESIGNKLPDPFILFVFLAAFVIVLSWIISFFDVAFIQPGEDEKVAVKSLVSGEGLEYILTSMLENFVGFKPLGIVLTMMLGIGLADKVGLLETFIKNTILQAPHTLITYAVVFTGILGNLAADAAFIIVPPLAAMVFYNLGRHPLAGLAAGFAGVGSGFTANIIIANTDAVIAGISADVMAAMDASVTVTLLDNYFFMVTSVFLLTITGGLITEKIVEPQLGTYGGNVSKEFESTKPIEKKALLNAALAAAGYIALLLIVIFIPGSPLLNEDGSVVQSPLLSGIVSILLLFFITVDIAYGIITKKIESSRSIAQFMGEGIKD